MGSVGIFELDHLTPETELPLVKDKHLSWYILLPLGYHSRDWRCFANPCAA